jgi:hypothetical protein
MQRAGSARSDDDAQPGRARSSEHSALPEADRPAGPQADLTGAGRIASAGYAQRFSSMLSWENSDHPVVLFYVSPTHEVGGVDVLSLNSRYVDQFLNRALRDTL